MALQQPGSMSRNASVSGEPMKQLVRGRDDEDILTGLEDFYPN